MELALDHVLHKGLVSSNSIEPSDSAAKAMVACYVPSTVYMYIK
jgi:hypothetical protein